MDSGQRIQQDENIRRKLILEDEASERRLKEWLQEPVHHKQSNGEAAFKKMLGYLKKDLSGLKKKVSDKTLSEKDVNQYLVAFYQYHFHNSTTAPYPGHGKAQQKEREHPLLYYRSQKDHPYKLAPKDHAYKDTNYSKLLTIKNADEKKENNERYLNLHAGNTLNNAQYLAKDKATLQSFQNRRGKKATLNPNKKLPVDYRLPRYQPIFPQQQSSLAESLKHKHHVLSQSLPREKHIKLDNLVALLPDDNTNLFIWVKYYQPFDRALRWQNYRVEEKEKITQDEDYQSFCHKLGKKGINNPFDELGLDDEERRQQQLIGGPGANYTEGWVNVVLTFFIALLNTNCENEQFALPVIRRQSFGFNRPTVSDVGECIRLSMGNMPNFYGDIIKLTLDQLDTAITNLSPEINILAQIPIEKSQSGGGKNKTLKTGNFYKYALRSKAHRLSLIEKARDIIGTAPTNDYGLSQFIFEHIIYFPTVESTEQNIKKTMKNVFSALNYNCANEFDAVTQMMKGLTLPEPVFQTTHLQESQQALPGSPPYYLLKLNDLIKITQEKCQRWKESLEDSNQMRNTYAYIYQKVHNNIEKGIYLLQHRELFLNNRSKEAHLYAKSVLVYEELLENIILIKAMRGIHKLLDPEIKNDSLAIDGDVRLLNYFRDTLNIQDDQIQYFRTQNGQSAATLGIYLATALASTCSIKKDASLQNIMTDTIFEGIYLDKAYYETCSFLEDFRTLVQGQLTRKQLAREINAHTSMIITNINSAYAEYPFDKNDQLRKTGNLNDLYDQLPPGKTMLVDCTNTHLFDCRILKLIKQWKKNRGKYIILFASLLKHEELGLDKYQAGRLIVLEADIDKIETSTTIVLKKNKRRALRKLKAHSDGAKNRLTESYLRFAHKLLYPNILNNAN